MKWLEIVRANRQASKCGMARTMGIDPTHYKYLCTRAHGCRMVNLVKWRKALGLSWTELGKLLDATGGE